MRKYLFAFDLDGTLLNDDGELTKETIEGIKKIKEMGHEMCLITGRNWEMTKKIYDEAGLDSPVGLFTGGVIRKGKDKTFKDYVNSISEDEVKKVIKDDLFLNFINCFSIETFDKTYISDMKPKSALLRSAWEENETLPIKPGQKYDQIIGIFSELKTKDIKEAQDICRALRWKYHNLDVFYLSSYTFVDGLTMEVTSLTTRKEFALIRIAKHFNIPLEDTVSFGNGSNDDIMLLRSGIGVAMKNSEKYVMNYANQVTEYTNNENGVVRHIFEKILVD